MARGFESKSVADQQDDKQRRADRPARAPLATARTRTLELGLTDLTRRLAAAEASGNTRLAEMLRRAAEHLRAQLTTERGTAGKGSDTPDEPHT